MHDVRRWLHPGAVKVPESLMPQTNAKQRYALITRRLQGIHTEPKVLLPLGSPGSWGKDDVIPGPDTPPRQSLAQRGPVAILVVAHDDRGGSVNLGEELVQIVRVRVVVIDEQGTRRGGVETRRAGLRAREMWRAPGGGWLHGLTDQGVGELLN